MTFSPSATSIVGAVGHLVLLELAALGVHDGDFAVALQGDQALVAFGVRAPRTALRSRYSTVPAGDGLDVALDHRAGGDAAGVERTHGELRARLADRLGGDDADGQAFLDQLAGGQVHAVAAGADAARALAGQRAADADGLDAQLLDLVGDLVGDDLVLRDDDLVGDRVDGWCRGRRGRRSCRCSGDVDLSRPCRWRVLVTPLSVPQSMLVDDDVLGHVGQLAGQVARVGGLEGGVGQTLAGAVRRAEVLEHRQAFAEVGLDGRLDDLAGRLGHQAAHAGELADLVDDAAGAGVGHQADRVEVAAALRSRRRARSSPSSSRRSFLSSSIISSVTCSRAWTQTSMSWL